MYPNYVRALAGIFNIHWSTMTPLIQEMKPTGLLNPWGGSWVERPAYGTTVGDDDEESRRLRMFMTPNGRYSTPYRPENSDNETLSGRHREFWFSEMKTLLQDNADDEFKNSFNYGWANIILNVSINMSSGISIGF